MRGESMAERFALWVEALTTRGSRLIDDEARYFRVPCARTPYRVWEHAMTTMWFMKPLLPKLDGTRGRTRGDTTRVPQHSMRCATVMQGRWLAQHSPVLAPLTKH